jgi:hypothetical protein
MNPVILSVAKDLLLPLAPEQVATETHGINGTPRSVDTPDSEL